MTREEKSNLLNELLEYEENNDIGNLTRAERREFQQWISEALEQEPCEDAISRQDALDALHMCLGTNSYDDDVTGDSYICYEEAEYEIEKLPPVQLKPIECSDAISREQAIDTVANLFEMSEYPHLYPQGKPIRLRDIKEKLKQLSPAIPQPKTGH